MFRKDFIPGQNGGPVVMVTSSGCSCGTMESMSMSKGWESEMTRKSGWTEAAIASEDKCRSNEVVLLKDVCESISNTNFESKLIMKSSDNQMSKDPNMFNVNPVTKSFTQTFSDPCLVILWSF